jgi:uncharacterized damage-inducible protein DinB
LPAKLEGEFSTAEAATALEANFELLMQLLGDALRGDGRIESLKPDVASFLGYLIAHDAHHREQIALLARQVGRR